ncbi:MAG: hypothetical protein COA63_014185 [Methylophaga sp.]|nr:hypothetical protein [Methylophaga sp.]
MFNDVDSSGMEEQKDSLGGYLVDSALYTGKITMAYAGSSDSGSKSITIHVDLNGTDFRETFWVVSGKTKGFHYMGGKDGKSKIPLPSFTHVNNICLVTTGTELKSQKTEEKMVSIYNSEAKKAIPTSADVLVGLIGKEIQLGILRQIVDKQIKGDGGYINSGETREENAVNGVFHPVNHMTVSEAKAGDITEGEFIVKWDKKHTGNTLNKAKGAEGKSGKPGGASAGTPKKSLFDK